jgi:flagellar protein FliS
MEMSINGYKQTVLATTDRIQITLMLYDGALNQLKMAKAKMQNGDIASKGSKGIHFTKATNIISELSNVLDMEKGGELSRNLRNLYEFVLRRLLHSNLNNDIKALEDAERVVAIIRDAWKEMMTKIKQPQQSEQSAQIQVGV